MESKANSTPADDGYEYFDADKPMPNQADHRLNRFDSADWSMSKQGASDNKAVDTKPDLEKLSQSKVSGAALLAQRALRK